jgi:UDPglucose 6-dehydrogenase
MDIAVVGVGYVGLVVGTCLADTGNTVICVDKDKDKIKGLKKGVIPIYEPGLSEILKRNKKEGRLSFTTKLKEAVEKSKIIFIAVGTPPNDDGSIDLTALNEVAGNIGDVMSDEYKIIVTKSTVPVGTTEKVGEIIASKNVSNFDVVSNPEFLKEGDAVGDFMKPDRIIIGTEKKEVAELLKELYAPFVRTGNPILAMSIKSAEMTKYASNAILASRISFMNEISNLCDKVGADVEDVRIAMGKDPRIGSKFIFPGVGYGGSCFPKDVKALNHIGKNYGVDMEFCRAIDSVNERQKKLLFEKINSHFDSLKGKKFAVWGLSFKPKTDDMREASSIVTINNLLKEKAIICAFDPVAINTAKNIFGDKINYGKSPFDCLKDADALVVITEWNEFRHPDFEEIGRLLKRKVIFDGRNIYNPEKLRNMGFTYYGIGRH